MEVKIVCYDLENESINEYDRIIDAINSLGTAKEIQRSVWLLKTSYTSKEVRDHLKQYIHSNDKLFIGRLNQYSSFNLPKSISETIFSEWS